MAVQIQTFDGSISDEIARILWRAVETAPEDMVAKGALADRLDEIGDTTFLSRALRWCLKYGKHPRVFTDAGRFLAGWLREERPDEVGPHHIPRPIFDAMGGAEANANVYIAYVGIASALRHLEEIIN